MICNDRPDACATADGRVAVFVGGTYRIMTISAALTLLDHLRAAIEKAGGSKK